MLIDFLCSLFLKSQIKQKFLQLLWISIFELSHKRIEELFF